ncbi:sensor histidine kinase [Thiomicrospira microaerophila]|uniref:sensor histidine kinase n=1 Tax=Thiomicrospira microaerophila TaxID=406020 RepID=UPI0005C84605|nr:HAMP domain-containing sensor histidine kinase [Thiomicrospira microaerophila]
MIKNYLPLLAGGFLYFFTAKLGMSIFSLQPTGLSLLWLPFGIAVILVEKYGLKSLPIIFLASFLSHLNLATDTDLFAIIHRIIPSIADSLAPLLAVYLLKKYVKTDFNNISILLPFSLLVGVIPSLLTGVVISFNWMIAGDIAHEMVINYIVMIVFSDTLGLLLLYPLYKSMDNRDFSSNEKVNFLLFLSLGIIITLISIEYGFLIFLLYPLLLISVFKLNIKYIMTLLLLLVIFTLALSSQFTISYFIADTPMSAILMLSSFLATLTFIVMGMALVMIAQDSMSQHICQIEKDHVKIALEKSHAQAIANKEREDKEQKAQFLSMLSHELKTPLSVIRMGVSQQTMSDSLRNHIIQASNDMGMVIDRCAVLEKVDENVALKIQTVNLVSLINYVTHHSQAPERIRLDFTDAITNLHIQTDEDWLKVILSNLIDNALKYSPKDTFVRIYIRKEKATWCIGVCNQINEPAPDAKHIFDKYYRSPKARMQTGSGLGLYIVKRLALQLQTHIEYIPMKEKVIFRLCLTIQN